MAWNALRGSSAQASSITADDAPEIFQKYHLLEAVLPLYCIFKLFHYAVIVDNQDWRAEDLQGEDPWMCEGDWWWEVHAHFADRCLDEEKNVADMQEEGFLGGRSFGLETRLSSTASSCVGPRRPWSRRRISLTMRSMHMELQSGSTLPCGVRSRTQKYDVAKRVAGGSNGSQELVKAALERRSLAGRRRACLAAHRGGVDRCGRGLGGGLLRKASTPGAKALASRANPARDHASLKPWRHSQGRANSKLETARPASLMG